MSDQFAVRAEICELHENGGHCYLELIEKDETDTIIAKQHGNIWRNRYTMLKSYFEQATGLPLQAGMKVSLTCTLEFHEVYGISLNITDIDPAYTVGELAIRRAAIIHQLTEMGIIDMNRQLEMPVTPQRIAVISSATAAGYGDFCDQLAHNAYGYRFYVKLFAAQMQGSMTEPTVLAALDRICSHADLFDAVAIIRGGGSTSDLAAFDNFPIAEHVAQFPLPVLSGIGHQRDNTIVDMVAHTRVKTPTAAAEFFIDAVHEAEMLLHNLSDALATATRELLYTETQKHVTLCTYLPHAAQQTLNRHRLLLQQCRMKLRHGIVTLLDQQQQALTLCNIRLNATAPQTQLKRGFIMAEKDGHVVASASALTPGDRLRLTWNDGIAETTINTIELWTKK